MKSKILVCQGISCKSRGGDNIFNEGENALGDSKDKLEITRCNCMGNCGNGPNVAEETRDKTTIHDFMNTEKIINLIKKILHATK